jgi:hypothetical protein
MKNKLKLLALGMLAGGTMLAAPRVSIGVNIGGYGPAPAPVYDAYSSPAYAAQYQPPCPGPGYVWVDGYWSPQARGRVWVSGFWRAPAYPVAPVYRGHDRDRDNHETRFDRGHSDKGHFEREGGNNFRR